MSTELNKVSAKKEISKYKKILNISNKSSKISDDLENKVEEKIEKKSTNKIKKKTDISFQNNKLDSSSITSNGMKNYKKNDSFVINLNGNFSFSKLKKMTPTIKEKPKNLRTQSAVNLIKKDINGLNENNHCEVNDKFIETKKKVKNREKKYDNNPSNNDNMNFKNSESKAKINNLNKTCISNNKSTKIIINNIDKSKNSPIKNDNKNSLNNSNNKKISLRKNSDNKSVFLDETEKVEIENDLPQKETKEGNKSITFSETYERFKNHEVKLNLKKESMRKKKDEDEKKELKNVPKINKASKYYEKSNEDFLKRVEVYKFVSNVRKMELMDKEKKRLDNELNKNPKLRQKMKLEEIQKIIDEKLKADKIKKTVREEKNLEIIKTREEGKLAECTFFPEICETSRKMDLSFRLNKLDLMKSLSAPRFLETENSRINKKLDFNTSLNNNNNIINDELFNNDKDKNSRNFIPNQSSGDKLSQRKALNNNKSANNIFSHRIRNSNKVDDGRNQNNKSFRESKSMNRLTDSPEKHHNFLNSSNLNETVYKDVNKSMIDFPFNVSKKESDIMKELLKKKYNI